MTRFVVVLIVFVRASVAAGDLAELTTFSSLKKTEMKGGSAGSILSFSCVVAYIPLARGPCGGSDVEARGYLLPWFVWPTRQNQFRFRLQRPSVNGLIARRVGGKIDVKRRQRSLIVWLTATALSFMRL